MQDVPVDSEEFDYVVVGAGAAGCIVAARLSEDPTVSVCLLESGPNDRHPFLAIPGGFTRMVGNERYTWQFPTEPTPLTGGRSLRFTQGRTLGGSTSLNGMIFNRGQARDFDRWVSAGNAGWGYEDVLPFYKKLETRVKGDPAYRGKNGELPITDTQWDCPTVDAFVEAAKARGMRVNDDYNAATQAGIAITQQNIAHGRRMSTSVAFLRPNRHRKNLAVRVDATVSRVLFQDRRAVGVSYVQAGASGQRVIKARREVIVSAGAINTPRLLQISGVGDPGLLGQLGAPVVQALPGVGQNFTDHYLMRLTARGKGFRSINQLARGPALWGQVARWMFGRPSILSISPVAMHFFAASGVGGPDDVDLQGTFTPANYKPGSRDLDDRPGMTFAVWQHRPRSRGYVRARSRDILQVPEVQPNYLADEHDRKVAIAGLRLCRQFFQTDPLRQFVEDELEPGRAIQSDAEWLGYASRNGTTAYHAMGTAKMGPATDPLSVVDNELRVHGIQGLRIVDASIMPVMPSANTAATTMMIGEKAAAMIKSAR